LQYKHDNNIKHNCILALQLGRDHGSGVSMARHHKLNNLENVDKHMPTTIRYQTGI